MFCPRIFARCRFVPVLAAALSLFAAPVGTQAAQVTFGFYVGGATPLTFFPGTTMGVEWHTGRYTTQPSGAQSGDVTDFAAGTPGRLTLPAVGGFTSGLTVDVAGFAGASASTPLPFAGGGFTLIRPKSPAFNTGDSLVFTFQQDVVLRGISFYSAAATETVEISANGTVLHSGSAFHPPARELDLGGVALAAGQPLRVRATLSPDGFHMATLTVAAPSAPEVIRLPRIFADGSVLQRDTPLPIWGRASPGETVTVSFRGQSKSGVADASGRFEIVLDPQTAGGPFTLTVSGTASASFSVANVYVGDVWLCSGQSNMWYRLVDHTGPTQYPTAYGTVPNATDHFDNLRLAMVSTETAAAPLDEHALYIPWSAWKNTPLPAGAALNWMAATPYFFGRALRSALDAHGHDSVPIGVLVVAFGGTSIEQWIPAAALNAAGPWPSGSVSPHLVGNCYNAMLAPIERFPVKGVLWYQGENNSGNHVRVGSYRKLQETLVASWRAARGHDFPFYFVQLAGYMNHSPIPKDNDASVSGYNINWAWIREAQASSLATIPNSAMVVAIDTGDQANIHPSGKDLVAQRLADIALARDYGIPTVHRGPVLVSQEIVGGDVILTFDHVGGGLQSRLVDAQPDADELAKGRLAVRAPADTLRGFALAGANKVFYHATRAEILSPTQVRVSNVADVPAPVAVRYAWQSFPNANLSGGTGLPAEPFRTDSFTPDTSTGADSTPVAEPIPDRRHFPLADPEAQPLTVNLAAVFRDIEDGDAARPLTFAVTGNSDPALVTSTAVSPAGILTLTCADDRQGTATLTVRATDSAGRTATATFTVSVELATFAAWQRLHFTSAELADPGLEATRWGAIADPDHDALSNLLEYAVATDPLSPDGDVRPVSLEAVGDTVVVRYRRSKALATDPAVSLQLQSTPDLAPAAWSLLDAPDTLHSDLGDAELRQVTLPAADTPRRFIRLVATRTPDSP